MSSNVSNKNSNVAMPTANEPVITEVETLIISGASAPTEAPITAIEETIIETSIPISGMPGTTEAPITAIEETSTTVSTTTSHNETTIRDETTTYNETVPETVTSSDTISPGTTISKPVVTTRPSFTIPTGPSTTVSAPLTETLTMTETPAPETEPIACTFEMIYGKEEAERMNRLHPIDTVNEYDNLPERYSKLASSIAHNQVSVYNAFKQMSGLDSMEALEAIKKSPQLNLAGGKDTCDLMLDGAKYMKPPFSEEKRQTIGDMMAYANSIREIDNMKCSQEIKNAYTAVARAQYLADMIPNGGDVSQETLQKLAEPIENYARTSDKTLDTNVYVWDAMYNNCHYEDMIQTAKDKGLSIDPKEVNVVGVAMQTRDIYEKFGWNTMSHDDMHLSEKEFNNAITKALSDDTAGFGSVNQQKAIVKSLYEAGADPAALDQHMNRMETVYQSLGQNIDLTPNGIDIKRTREYPHVDDMTKYAGGIDLTLANKDAKKAMDEYMNTLSADDRIGPPIKAPEPKDRSKMKFDIDLTQTETKPMDRGITD